MESGGESLAALFASPGGLDLVHVETHRDGRAGVPTGAAAVISAPATTL